MQATTKLFSYDRRTGRLVTEASNLGSAGQELFHRIYQDACDEGITLISHKTGREAKFYLDQVHKDHDGDIQVWILRPTTETVRANPGLRGVTVHILND